MPRQILTSGQNFTINRPRSVPVSPLSPPLRLNDSTVRAENEVVDPEAFTKINQDVLLATLRGFAEHGFSGDIEFRLEGRQILRTVCENHVFDPPEPSEEATQSVERNWPQLEKWAEGSETLLQVMFQRGKITKVRSTDRTERWQLVQK